MTETAIYTLAAIGIYYLVLLFTSIYPNTQKSDEAYIIGDRKVSFLPTLSSLTVGFRDGAGIVFWVGAGLTIGYGGLWLVLGVFLGLMFYVYQGPKIRAHAKQNNYISIGQIISERIGPHTKLFTAVIIITFSFMYVAMQLFVSGNLIANILGFEEWSGIASVALIIAIYLYFGGYNNVIKTDTMQFVLIASLIAIPFFLPPTKEQVFNFSSINSLGTTNSFAFFLIGLFWMLSSAEIWQRVFSAKNDRVIRTAFSLGAPTFLLMTLSLLFLGFAMSNILLAGTEAQDIFFAIFKTDQLSPILQAYIAVIALAITMSTLDTFCYLGAATFAKDIASNKYTANTKDYKKITRIFMIGTLLGMSIIALQISDLIQFLFDAVSLLFILAPLYVVSVMDVIKKSAKIDTLLSASLSLSVALYVYLFTTGAFANMLYLFLPVLLNAASCAIACVISKKS